MAQIRLNRDKLDTQALLTDILLFEKQWDSAVDVQQTTVLVADIVSRIEQAMQSATEIDGEDLALDQLNAALDCFYLNMAFSSTTQNLPESQLNSLSYLVHYHTGECLSMSILLNHVLTSVGFDCTIMVINHEIMLQVKLANQEIMVIDAISGEQFGQPGIDGSAVLPSLAIVENRALDKTSLIQIYLTQQKLAFTDEHKFDSALCCIELLIKSTPDDPYQRRDRGFLLHQLDCFNQARNDFEFFIDQCPEDPAAQLLKAQLEDFENAEHTVH